MWFQLYIIYIIKHWDVTYRCTFCWIQNLIMKMVYRDVKKRWIFFSFSINEFPLLNEAKEKISSKVDINLLIAINQTKKYLLTLKIMINVAWLHIVYVKCLYWANTNTRPQHLGGSAPLIEMFLKFYDYHWLLLCFFNWVLALFILQNDTTNIFVTPLVTSTFSMYT